MKYNNDTFMEEIKDPAAQAPEVQQPQANPVEDEVVAPETVTPPAEEAK